MGNRKWLNNYKFLILLLLAIAIVSIVGVIFFDPVTFSSPVSPLKSQAIEEEFDNLDGVGEIKWYENFFTWNPRAQITSYPFITGTYYVHWSDIDTGLSPVSIPYTATELIIDLELRGTNTYTQQLRGEISGQPEPSTGVFDSFIWIWIDVEPGIYDEYIKAYWLAGDEIIPVQLVDNGEIVRPVIGFVPYRKDLIIPHLVYLPIVGKHTP